MFRRFIDLSLSQSAPGYSSIWRFRQLLNTEKLLEALLTDKNKTTNNAHRFVIFLKEPLGC
ncbi:MAG: hypothetical protein A6F72_00715 [Cycloclasticus sp. symbiont of Poecilosclerida sp. N]|nr:MAG: hypothetical protein A6F72_00715 [Cycloclasticus sp. symbiont of Poecilosclerida sp. N]